MNAAPWESLLVEFESELAWLHTLIRDPAGTRYQAVKSPAERLAEFAAGLERTRRFLDFLDNPQNRYPAAHIAGTSGKGSVTVMLAALLQSAGARTGYHVSPYLQIPNEKLVIAGRPISPSAFVQLARAFRRRLEAWTAQGGDLLYAEAWTALTFFWLAQERVDWAVIETSMGGRYDPTNTLPAAASIITNVNYDHIPQLGTTLAEIADHKAGIIKPGRPALTGVAEPELLAVLKREAQANNSPLYVLGRDFRLHIEQLEPDGSWLSVDGPAQRYGPLFLPLAGAFQARNAALAIDAADLLAQAGGPPQSTATMQQALDGLRFPGRMEIVQPAPLVLLDASHNRHKMAALAQALRRLYAGRKITLLLGVLAMKDAAALLAEILPLGARVIITQPHVFGKPAFNPHTLAAEVARLAPGAPVDVHEPVAAAVQAALEGLDPAEMLVVTGSMYLVGEARSVWFPPEELLKHLEKGQPT